MKKLDLTHVRISREARRRLQIIAKTYDRSIRDVVDSLVEQEFKSLIKEPINAENSI
jgi:hypothetical protein